MKTGLIDVGGGFRGIYGAGVMDYFMDNNITFDYTIGVSAGSANIASYLAGQRGRNVAFYTVYSERKRYASFLNYFKKRSYLDLDYVYRELSKKDGENPLDYKKLIENPAEYKIVACNAYTGETKYFTKDDLSLDDYEPLIASSSLPVICPPCYVGGDPYYDGGISDPIPFQKAFDDGCDKLVIILTKPRDFRRNADDDTLFASIVSKNYPEAGKRLYNRYKTYNYSLDLAEEYAKEGKILIIAPDDTCGLSTIKRTTEGLFQFYAKGYNDAKAVKDFLKED